MFRPPSKPQTVSLHLFTTRQAADYLRQLASTGLYGKNMSEVAERLVTQRMSETLLSRFDVFLSHSSRDAALAREMGRALERKGLQCFMAERDIAAGGLWKEEIRTALQMSRVVVVLITPSALKSGWVISEVAASWALGKPMIPALVNVSIQDLPEVVTEFKCRPFETGKDRRDFAAELKRICESGPRRIGKGR